MMVAPQTGSSETAGGYPDMGHLVRGVRAFVEARVPHLQVWDRAGLDGDAFTAPPGLAPRGQGKAEVVLAPQVAVELGHPTTASQAAVLTTYEAGAVHPGRISLVGPDLATLPRGTRRPFGQVVCLQLAPGSSPDPFTLETTQYLFNRLPGYMVRSMPGRLWARVSLDGRAGGLGMATIGDALVAAFLGDFDEVRAAEVVLVTSSRDDVDALAPFVLEAQALSGRHKKLVLAPDGTLECRELSCETCDEKPVCDAVREVLARRRSAR